MILMSSKSNSSLSFVYMTCNLQKRVDTVSLNEKRRKEEREEVKRGWLPGRGLNPSYLLM